MEFYQLVYFKKIAESENITKASADLNISQPSLSRSLKNLESELGVQLFNREGKKLLLNENGIVFLGYTDHILDTLNEAREKMKQQASVYLPPVNIAMIHDNRLLPQLLAAFHQSYPHIHINLYHFSSPHKIPAECSLVLHASEEMIGSSPFRKSTKLLSEECMIGLSREHPMAKQETLSLQALSKESFIVLSQENSFGAFSRGFFQILGFKPKIIVECDSQIMIDSLVAQNVGLALFPSETWEPSKEQIVLKRIENHHLYQPLYVSCTSAMTDPSTQLFYDYAVAFFKAFENRPDAPSCPI
ncbi:LysR family transcriptional regulator [Lacrimispora sp. NSJ-141]|uniref:LysR family transcriptional regulator n=1 Tax=Lientehia hominis TaxID=2897778 RepID=A0AAP2RLD2_9FIRM|nr:LysR family transcriptional regulator [Lientehia hominis]MCD2493058.1 LysR family transcriptional regulator [Lientehia hominis]